MTSGAFIDSAVTRRDADTGLQSPVYSIAGL
jgi:hypothetical protein